MEKKELSKIKYLVIDVDGTMTDAGIYYDENGNELAAVVKSGNNKLLNVLNKSIAILKNNGKLDELNGKWFPVEETTQGEE